MRNRSLRSRAGDRLGKPGRFGRLVWFIPWLILLGFLSACANEDDESITARPLSTPTKEPTPTLAAGLPTSTPPPVPVTGETGNQPLSPTPWPSPTPAPPPTATPVPAKRLDLGQEFLESEDFSSAAEQYKAGLLSEGLSHEEQLEALYGLGRAGLELGQGAEAVETFMTYLAEATSVGVEASQGVDPQGGSGEMPAQEEVPAAGAAYFFLGQALEMQGDCEGAIGAYQSYLADNPDMNAYVLPRVAACQLALGNREAAIAAYEEAAEGQAELLTAVNLGLQLAQMLLEDGNYAAAIEQYDEILNIAQSEATRGQVTYLAGAAELLAGNEEAGYARYEEAVGNYPRAYESYLALTALVEAGQPVDEFQRGLVDFYAKAFDPAIAAFNRYIEANPVHNEDAHLYLAWSFEGLGNVETALAHVDAFIQAHQPAVDENDEGDGEGETGEDQTGQANPNGNAAKGWIEKAKIQARAGLTQEAIDSYLTYLELFPDGEDGPLAAWWAAALTEQTGNSSMARERYLDLAERFPAHEDAPEALFRAGYLSWVDEEIEEAQVTWQQAAERYPDRRYGAAALVWLLRILDRDETQPFQEQAAATRFEDYYALRASQIASDTTPFEPADGMKLTFSPADQAAAESWLREWLGLEPSVNVRSLSDDLVTDDRLIRGRKLWQLGLKEEAKRELEDLRAEYAEDPLASYQLALFFGDLGLYRSSIQAATSVMRSAGKDVFGVPKFLGGLAYPTHYANLVLPAAEQYGIDPLLLFALIRQESLFESFARSSAAAQGLSQVIPDTGAYIAQQLNWPDYDNDDLYKPYVGIAFGSYYLDQQLDAFEGDVAAALSAYNGGPGNAARWYGQVPDDIDLYVQTVDFGETRQYIERIFTGHTVYRYLYGR